MLARQHVASHLLLRTFRAVTDTRLHWLDSAGASDVLRVRGVCTMMQLPALLKEIETLAKTPKVLDLSGLERLDSAGALVLMRLLSPTLTPVLKPNSPTANYTNTLVNFHNVQPAQKTLLALIAEHASTAAKAPPRKKDLAHWVASVGATVRRMVEQIRALIVFFGVIFQCFGAILLGRRKLRLTSVVHHIERTGFDAVPIICLLCFIFGSVVAYLSATAMKTFGAGILTVDIVSVSFLREFGVLLSAILVAGRSGSAFTAEIGSMRTREEIDAIQALSLDPVELLVIPRICALVITLPMLSFLAVLAGILGGAVVGATSLDITINMFLTRMQDNTELYYLWLGLLKAPVFAFLIAAIGCLEGLKVSGSAESVGLHTTSSVVQSIFLVIVVDALFAVLFMHLDL